MKTFFVVVLISLCGIVCCEEIDQSMDPPSWTWIRWGDVGANHFRVRWLPVLDADHYNVYLYKGYDSTNAIAEYVNVSGTNFVIGGLEIFNVYGIRVQCVGKTGHLSRLGVPARTWTHGKTTTTSTAAPTAPTPVGSCGVGFFTCETNNDECIHESWWCDKNKDCVDGTDERNCPGGCEEIVSWDVNGNFSCSRWNSPRSACFFQCNKTRGYQRDGAYYFMCIRGKWALPLPTCRLMAPTNFNLVSNGFGNVTITFDEVVSGNEYTVDSLTDQDGVTPSLVSDFENLPGKVSLTFTELLPESTYTLTVFASDVDGKKGFTSEKFIFETSL